MNVKFKASARTTALHRTGAGRQRNPTAPVGGEVFSLDIPFHRTYAGLGLVTRDTGQYQIVGGQIIRRQRPARVRGLNPQHNRELKEIFKSAALAATRPSSLLHAFYQQRLDQGMRPHLARLTLARKIASLTLTLWKKGERFNAHALTSQAE